MRRSWSRCQTSSIFTSSMSTARSRSRRRGRRAHPWRFLEGRHRAGALAGGSALIGALPALAWPGNKRRRHPELRDARDLESRVPRRSRPMGALTGETRTFAKVVAGTRLLTSPRPCARDERSRIDVRFKVIGNPSSTRPPGGPPASRLSRPGRNITRSGRRRAVAEAWHAAWISDLRRHGGKPYPAPTAFAGGKTKAQILAAVKGTGFIVG